MIKAKGSIMNISNNISSMMQEQTNLNSSAKNIASMGNNTKSNDTDLAKEFTDQIVAENVTELNVSAIQTQDNMLGTLLDIKA